MALNEMRTPPRLRRQKAYNPCPSQKRMRIQANLLRLQQLGLADPDCEPKWHKTIHQLKTDGHILMPTPEHHAMYTHTLQWFQDNAHKTLDQIKARPVRFPIHILGHSNGTVTIFQEPVTPRK